MSSEDDKIEYDLPGTLDGVNSGRKDTSWQQIALAAVRLTFIAVCVWAMAWCNTSIY